MSRSRVGTLIASLWVGSLWTIGLVVAPTLFATLADRRMAGSIAGALFRIEAWISIVCSIALLLLFRMGPAAEEQRKWLSAIIVVMLVCALLNLFGIQPLIAELRQQAGTAGIAASPFKAQFGLLHGLSSLIYGLQSLLGIVLVWKLAR